MARYLHQFDVQRFLSEAGLGRRIFAFVKGEAIYAQGDPCDSVFFVQRGAVKLAVVSQQGKEATIAILRERDFVGEECVSTVQPFRSATATALTDCGLLRISKAEMLRVLQEEPEMSGMFVAYILARTSRIQADLVDQLFNSSEKRLARTLLLLARYGKQDQPQRMLPGVSQGMLAEMIGTTRSRVNFFMNKFRKLGFIKYNGGLQINTSLLSVVLHD
jgi:CRP/FNR family transcriptional regulator, cyclic AMP receptor protein